MSPETPNQAEDPASNEEEEQLGERMSPADRAFALGMGVLCAGFSVIINYLVGFPDPSFVDMVTLVFVYAAAFGACR